ncbi:outer membrane protein [Bradyrhizobium liaoningense]|uniref:outer membrane protein n=1 Tax=Bradyrhizobium liaoningense TaxID=43992 RepID=UPI001BA9C327|nr:outer membrane protein [Bradyrhizobium liaoningense]MBR0718799.1 porin family protein [Bradyrhizobium liaoningense]
MMFSYRLALILAVGALAVAQASAADLPRRTSAPVPYVTPPAFTWTGAYVGVHASYARQQFGKSFEDRDSIAAGLQLGGNYQMGSIVLGAELEGSHLGGQRAKDSTLTKTSVDQKWLFAAKGRVGAAFDRTLVYGTAGLAMMEIDAKDPVGLTGGDKWKVGYLVGAGVEHAFTNNLSLKVEYNYVAAAQDYKVGGNKAEATDHIVKAGLNYRF